MVKINISQKVAILVDGNNIEKGAVQVSGEDGMVINFDTLVPKMLKDRSLARFVYFKEDKKGDAISPALATRLHNNFFGIVRPCIKGADVPLTIEAVQLCDKVDTIIIMSGDADYVELVKHLQANGVRVELASLKIALAKSLRAEADYLHEITSEDFFNPEDAYGKKKHNTKKEDNKHVSN